MARFLDPDKLRLLFICAGLTYITLSIAQDCMHPNAAFNYSYPNYSCPINSTCVVDTRYDPPNQMLTSIPVGCCPLESPKGCMKSDGYTGIDGCCGENQTCCYTASPLKRRWIGCADHENQCCINQICPANYFCCNTNFGHSCCPNGTTCFAQNFQVYVDGPGSIPVNFTELVNVSFTEDYCIPIEGGTTLIQYTLNNTNITENRESCGPDVLGDLKPEEWMVNLMNFTNFTTEKCGRHLCAENDTCVNRHYNGTLILYELNMTETICQMYDPNPIYVNIWPSECTISVPTPRIFEFPVGCCPTNYTPCGPYNISFEPVPAELPHVWTPTMGMIGCAGPDETCCQPYICPAGMKCCSNKFTINGTGPIYPANQTDRITPNFLRGSVGVENVTGLMIGLGQTQNICCPENAYCCQVEAPFPASFNGGNEFFAFCGLYPNCSLSTNRPNYFAYAEGVVGEALQQTESLMSVLLEGYDPLVRSEGSDQSCNMGFVNQDQYLRSCGTLGGQFQKPQTVPNTQVPPLTGKFRPNTDITEQIIAEVVYNVTMFPTPNVPPRPP